MESGYTSRFRTRHHYQLLSSLSSRQKKKHQSERSVLVESAVGPRRPQAETASRGRRPLNLISRMRGNG